MVPAIRLIIVYALLLHLIYLGCCRLIGLSRSVKHDRNLDLVVVHSFTFDSVTDRLLFSIEYNTKGLDSPSRSRLDSGVTTGEYSDPVSTRQSHSLALQVINLLLISAIVKLSFERQDIGEDVYIKQSIEHVEGRRLIPPGL